MYITQFNGGNFYYVSYDETLNNKKIFISNTDKYSDDYGYQHNLDYENIIIGKSIETGEDSFEGNTILVNLESNRWLYICDKIYEFNLPKDEKIIKYISNMGNNNVPYPFLVTDKRTYFFCEFLSLPNEFVNEGDPYYDLYTLENKSFCLKLDHKVW